MSKSGIQIYGIEDIDQVLTKVTPRHSRNLMRATVQAVASRTAKDARKRAPKESGTLRKAIKARRRKSAPSRPRSEVYVEHGQGAKNDAFYWRFVERGTMAGQKERPFLRPAMDATNADLNNILREEFGKKLESALKRERKKSARGFR